MKRLLAFLLALLMLLSLTTGFAGAAESEDLWEQIIAFENAQFRKTRALGGKVTESDYAALSAQVAAMVVASDDYTPGTCTYNGTNAAFFWKNADGDPQFYSPSLRAKIENGSNGVDPSTVGETVTASYANRVNPDAKDVYVIGPWYGSDSSFTDQYKNEGKSIAQASGGTYTLYSGNNATIDNVAAAMSNGAVVIFDSHGVTDYDETLSYIYPDYYDYVYDSVTEANTSYLTLTSGNGITSADKKAVTGTFGTYYHAASFESTDGDTVYCVDGTAIANHMTKNAPNNLLWMAICLGMATDGISTPLHGKGVEVVYGYSQSVTFDGDYDYEKHFWNSIKSGKTVAEAAAAMKKEYGNWDPAYYSDGNYYNTIEKARKYFIAFPVVVSSEDVHPGQRTIVSGGTEAQYGADSLQTVQSTWTLKSACAHSYSYTLSSTPTLSTTGALHGTCSKCSGTTTVTLPKLDTTNYTYRVTTEPTCNATGTATYTWKTTTYGTYSFPVTLATTDSHSYAYTLKSAPTLTATGELTGTCTRCSSPTTVTLPKLDTTNYTRTVTTEPTCTDGGFATYTWNNTAYGTFSFPTALSALSHSYITSTVDPTCTEQGYTNHICARCSDSYKDNYVAAKGHTEVVDAAVPATCTATGKTEGKRCSVCNAVTVAQQAVAKTAHSYQLGKCTVCGAADPDYKCDGGENCPIRAFSDVIKTQWYHDAIDYAVEHELFNGTSSSTFEPEGEMTRAMLVTVLWRSAGKPVEGTNTFSDVPNDQYYAQPVAWAAANGIVTGTSPTTFEPDENVTREQLATILYRYTKKLGVDVSTTGDLTKFSDHAKANDWAVDALKWAVGVGIISGDKQGNTVYLDPQGNATRAQVATIFMRYLETVAK